MTRAAMWAALIVCIAMQPAAAEPLHREDLRIPMEAAGPRGLEAMLLRPLGTRRYPLALISHGSPREGAARASMSPYRTYRQALEFARRIALNVFRTSGLPFRRRHHEAVEVVGYLDLARQARVRTHVETEIQHVFFHRGRSADLLAPGFVDIDVTGRAGTGAAAFGLDAWNGVANRGFHHGRAVLDINGSFFAGVVDKVDFGHDRSCCRNI
jgi:hypothetical protein